MFCSASHILKGRLCNLFARVFVSGCPGSCQACTYDGSGVRCVDGGCDASSYFDEATGTCISTSIVLPYFTCDNSKQILNTHLSSLQATSNIIRHCCDDSVIFVPWYRCTDLHADLPRGADYRIAIFGAILLLARPPTHSVGGQISNGRWRLSSSVVIVCRLSSTVTLAYAT